MMLSSHSVLLQQPRFILRHLDWLLQRCSWTRHVAELLFLVYCCHLKTRRHRCWLANAMYLSCAIFAQLYLQKLPSLSLSLMLLLPPQIFAHLSKHWQKKSEVVVAIAILWCSAMSLYCLSYGVCGGCRSDKSASSYFILALRLIFAADSCEITAAPPASRELDPAAIFAQLYL